MTSCTRCGTTAGSFIEVEPDEWACLRHFTRREVRALARGQRRPPTRRA